MEENAQTIGARRVLLGESIGHAAHDAWYGVAPVLLAALSAQMKLSNSDIGLILLLYQAVSSVTQPFFGRLCERIGGRPLAVGSILWTTLMFSGVIFAESKIILAVCISLAGFGSGAWHPQGAANATIAGGKRWGATTASIFFLGGTVGMAFLGSALGGYLLDIYGRHSLLLIAFITTLLALTVVRRMVPRWVNVPKRSQARGTLASESARDGFRPSHGAFWALLIVLLLGTALRSLTSNSLGAYVPKHMQDLGVSSASYGLLMSLFLFATAIGGVMGSYSADRLGLQRVLASSVALSALALLVFVRTEGLWSQAFFVLTGLLVGPSHTLFMVAGQRQFPQSMAMVAGIFLGFTFISGAVGAWFVGWLADRVGLGTMLGVLPWALLGAAVCALVGVPRSLPGLVSEEKDSVAA